MNDDTPMMTCDWCKQDFPADAQACVEAGVTFSREPAEGDEWREEDHLSPEELSLEHRTRLKAELELDDAQLYELLRTGKVEGLGAIVCLECQNAALEAAGDES
jgi:hypothetical protein